MSGFGEGVVSDEHGPAAPGDIGDVVSEAARRHGVNVSAAEVHEAIRTESGKQRRYLPGLSDLVDRLTISQLKAVFIPEHADAYHQEIEDLMHDIDIELAGRALNAEAIRAIVLIMLANRFIWENESKARAGGPEQDGLLKLTHSVNGIRNQAKNVLAAMIGGRKDYKTDCLASDLPPEFGNWNVFR